MTTTPIMKATELLNHGFVTEAHAHFNSKEKPVSFPGGGLGLLSQLASHPIFCKLTIAFLDHTSDITVATEFRSVVLSKTTFDSFGSPRHQFRKTVLLVC